MRRIWLWIGLAVAVIAILVAVNSFRGRLGWTAVVQTPADLAQQIAPGFTWVVPEGEGPFPAAMLLSGCDGPQSNLNRLAAELAEFGWLSVIVDSHGPRGLDDAQLWRLVCAGQILNGAERASDIAVALAILRDRPDVQADRIALIGLSHGGWAALDFLALAEAGTVPPLLTDWPETMAAHPHDGVRGAALFYPYCGLASVGSAARLPADLAYLFLLVDGDTITNERRCLTIAGSLLSQGATVAVTTYEGATHSFDQEEKSFLSSLEFNAETTAAATRATRQFLDGL